MAREDLHFRLRIPEEMKLLIEDAARRNQRSMTAEIISRLDYTFGKATEEVRELILEAEASEKRAREAQRTVAELSHSLRTREQEIDALKLDNEALRKETQDMREVVAGQEAVIDELRGLLEKASAQDAAQATDEPIFNIVLDAKGRPISWPEIAAHIHRTAKAAGIETAGFRAAIFNADKQDDEKFYGEYARLIRWYQDQTRKHKDMIRQDDA